MIRPLGRVVPAPVLRFADKHPSAVAVQRVDVTDWLAQLADDAIATLSVTAYPDTLTISADTIADSPDLHWLAAGGTDGTDHIVLVAFTATSGRADVQVWQCLVRNPTTDLAITEGITLDSQFRAFLATLPTSPDGLAVGAPWNNGGTVSLVTA